MRSVALVAALLITGVGAARADGVADSRRVKSVYHFELGFNLASYTFPEQQVPDTAMTESVAQTQWGVALRGVLFDPRKQTVQGHVPGVWVTFEVGKINGDSSTRPSSNDDDLGTGGAFYRQQFAAPWTLTSSDALRVAAGAGGEFGIAVGRTAITEAGAERDEQLLLAGGLLMAHVEARLGGLGVNGQYQWVLAGLGYSEHRVHGRLVRGRWTAGVDLLIGRRDGDAASYRSVGLTLGARFGGREIE